MESGHPERSCAIRASPLGGSVLLVLSNLSLLRSRKYSPLRVSILIVVVLCTGPTGSRVPQLRYISWLAGASRAFYSYTCAGLWPSCIFFFHRDIVSVVSPGSLLFFCMLLSLPASFRRRLPISSVLEDDSDSPPPPRSSFGYGYRCDAMRSSPYKLAKIC